jgi:hypothetical protein
MYPYVSRFLVLASQFTVAKAPKSKKVLTVEPQTLFP